MPLPSLLGTKLIHLYSVCAVAYSLFVEAALLESKKRESFGKQPIVSSIKSLVMSSIAAAIHSSSAVIHSPSSSSVESLGSSSGSPSLAPSTPVAAARYSLPASCPPTSNRTVPFVTVSYYNYITIYAKIFFRKCPFVSQRIWLVRMIGPCAKTWFSSTIEVESRSVEFISMHEASYSSMIVIGVMTFTHVQFQAWTCILISILSYWGCSQFVHKNLMS